VTHHKQFPIDDGHLSARGIHDLESGIETAEASFKAFWTEVGHNIGLSPEITSIRMGLLSMVTRAQGYHSAALSAVRDDNPYAAFTLVRCFAENAAALLWMMEKPGDLGRISVLAGETEGFAVGRLITTANKRAPGFGAVYEELSKYAHPVASSFSDGWQPGSGHRDVAWSSVPAFKVEVSKQLICFWLLELTEIHANTWPMLYTAGIREA
jgi:hypothetical protein